MTKEKILTKLQGMPEGALPPDAARQVVGYMIENWERLGGQVDHSRTHAFKVGRAENVTLTHPATVDFDVERHGALVCGSKYAELHHWTVDLLNETASYGDCAGRRLLYPLDRPLAVGPLARDILTKILAHDTKTDALRWKSIGDVRLVPAKVIPATNRVTTSARRKRLRVRLIELLAPHGWVETSLNRFRRHEAAPDVAKGESNEEGIA